MALLTNTFHFCQLTFLKNSSSFCNIFFILLKSFSFYYPLFFKVLLSFDNIMCMIRNVSNDFWKKDDVYNNILFLIYAFLPSNDVFSMK